MTGGTYGIGNAIAVLFAGERAKVAIAGHDEAKAKAALDALRRVNEHAMYMSADVSKSGDVRTLVEETVRKFGRIDI